MKKKIAVLGVVLSAVFVLSGCGQKEQNQDGKRELPKAGQNQEQKTQENQGKNGGEAPGMPEESKTVCEGKAEDDVCQLSFEGRDGEAREMTGRCVMNAEGEDLSCRPDQKAGPGPRMEGEDQAENE